MTFDIFIATLTIGATLTSLIVEAIKNNFKDKNYSYNLIAVFVGLLVGWVGTSTMYYLCGIPYTIANIICIVLEGFAIALSSMVGYDKVVQLINQMRGE